MQCQIRSHIAGLLSAAFPLPLHLHLLTLDLQIKESSMPARKVNTLHLQLWGKIRVPIVTRNSTSDRYPKACSGICRGIKRYTLFSFQILPVSRWGRGWLFTGGKGMLPCCCVSEIRCVHWQACSGGSIGQFLKLIGQQQLEVAGFGPTRPPNQQTTALLKSNLLMIYAKRKIKIWLQCRSLEIWRSDWYYFPETDMSWSSQNGITSTYHTISLILFFFLHEVVHQRLLGRAERQ